MIFGTHQENTLAQLADVASRAERAALMADGHLRAEGRATPAPQGATQEGEG